MKIGNINLGNTDQITVLPVNLFFYLKNSTNVYLKNSPNFYLKNATIFYLKITQFLVYPLIAILFFISLFLIPEWNFSAIQQVPSASDFLSTLWISIPVLVFAFNHSPAISAFAMAQRKEYGNKETAEKKARQTLLGTSAILLGFVMLFVFSCVLSLSPSELAEAKASNISILSYLANKNANPFIAYLGPIVAFIAIVSSFFGHYLGAREGLNRILIKTFRSQGKELDSKKINRFTALFICSLFAFSVVQSRIFL